MKAIIVVCFLVLVSCTTKKIEVDQFHSFNPTTQKEYLVKVLGEPLKSELLFSNVECISYAYNDKYIGYYFDNKKLTMYQVREAL
jgi:hypothetical protein